MPAASDAEFFKLLKTDIDYFTRALERFEDLIPRVCAPVQDQWRLQAQARKNFAMDLRRQDGSRASSATAIDSLFLPYPQLGDRYHLPELPYTRHLSDT